jgi:hypothetical protein
VYSINPNSVHAKTGPQRNWGDVANPWRTTDDITNAWDTGQPTGTRWASGTSSTSPFRSPGTSPPGRFNDPDMMEVGRRGMTDKPRSTPPPARKAQIWDFNGRSNQQWTVTTDGAIRGAQAGLCLDVDHNLTANGTAVLLWTCSAAANQRWSRS